MNQEALWQEPIILTWSTDFIKTVLFVLTHKQCITQRRSFGITQGWSSNNALSFYWALRTHVTELSMSFGPDEMSPQSACRLEPDRLPFEILQRFLLSLQTTVCLERSIRSVLLPKRSLAQKKSMLSSMNVNRSCHVVPQVEFSAEDRGVIHPTSAGLALW